MECWGKMCLFYIYLKIPSRSHGDNPYCTWPNHNLKCFYFDFSSLSHRLGGKQEPRVCISLWFCADEIYKPFEWRASLFFPLLRCWKASRSWTIAFCWESTSWTIPSKRKKRKFHKMCLMLSGLGCKRSSTQQQWNPSRVQGNQETGSSQRTRTRKCSACPHISLIVAANVIG